MEKTKELQELVNFTTDIILETFGIKLSWSEKALLKHYYNSSKDRLDGDLLYDDLYTLFMQDTFGLDCVELGDQMTYGKKGGKLYGKQYGMGYIDTPEFKKYCKRNVDVWRQDRELI